MKISIVIPVYNEKGRLENVLNGLSSYFEVIIIDDGSTIPVDTYIDEKKYHNVRILTNEKNMGYLVSIKKAILQASGEIIVTMDGDGEHKPEDIVKLVDPILRNACDIVFGKRPNIARPSEVFLLKIARVFTGEKVKDSGTGFRAIRTEYAKRLKFKGMCTCGLILVESHFQGMRICEVEVNLPIVNKVRRVAWEHFLQLFYVLWYIMKLRKVN